MTEEVAGGPVEEQRTSPVLGDQSPALDDTQQRAGASTLRSLRRQRRRCAGVRMGDGGPDIAPGFRNSGGRSWLLAVPGCRPVVPGGQAKSGPASVCLAPSA
jgi:hypothetical protein